MSGAQGAVKILPVTLQQPPTTILRPAKEQKKIVYVYPNTCVFSRKVFYGVVILYSLRHDF